MQNFSVQVAKIHQKRQNFENFELSASQYFREISLPFRFIYFHEKMHAKKFAKCDRKFLHFLRNFLFAGNPRLVLDAHRENQITLDFSLSTFFSKDFVICNWATGYPPKHAIWEKFKMSSSIICYKVFNTKYNNEKYIILHSL